MTDHTPLPWKYVPWHIEEGPSAVRAPDGHLICSTASDANAAFIVKAVNAWDDIEALVTALKDIADIAEGSETANSLPHLAKIARKALASIKEPR